MALLCTMLCTLSVTRIAARQRPRPARAGGRTVRALRTAPGRRGVRMYPGAPCQVDAAAPLQYPGVWARVLVFKPIRVLKWHLKMKI